VSDNLRRFFAIMGAILAAYFLLQVLRSFAITAEARGVCAGVAGYMVGDFIATPQRRRKRS
jgi:hypothetical protein